MNLRNRFSPYTVYLFITAGLPFCLHIAFTINLLFQVQEVGLSPLQLVLVGTVLEATAFIFEVPTGVVADVYSRRLSVIIGYFLLGSSVMMIGLLPHFETILMAQVIAGIGYTFMSGAEEAWIADEIGEGQVGPVYVRGSQMEQFGRLAGAGVSVALASVSLTLAIVTSGALVVLMGLILIVIMPERGFKPAPREERSSFQQMANTFVAGTQLVRRRPVLLTILGIAAFFGMFNEGWDRLWTALLLEQFTLPSIGPFNPVVWFGIFSAGVTVLSIVTLEFVRRNVNMGSHRAVTRTLFLINGLLALSVVVYAVAGSYLLAVLSFFAASTLRQTVYPLTTAWVNQSIDSRVRATVISMTSQADAFGQIAGGPAIGAIGSFVSLRAALSTAGLVLTPGLGLYFRALRLGEGAKIVGDVGVDPQQG
ncbi:MAG: MFS transporter [Chloroflexi bacterium]|nr:MAG: MFS transporter [Chloroflexota bacterium]